MAQKKDGLRYEPLYRYHPTEGTPRKRPSLAKVLLRILSLGLVGRPHREEFKAKGGAKHVHLSADQVVGLQLRTRGATLHQQCRPGVTDGGEGGDDPQES